LNIDACRIASNDAPRPFANPTQAEGWRLNQQETDWQPSEIGRWPANLMHDGSEEVLNAFPDAPGQQRAVEPHHGAKPSVNTYGDFGPRETFTPRLDAGSAARFFYCAKASKHDRDDGLDRLPTRQVRTTYNKKVRDANGGDSGYRRANTHPTVKPTELMRYLCRLVTPPGGCVLDPYMGSGSTIKAAELEGFEYIGIEIDPDYHAIASSRIASDAPLFRQAA
jgi:site-specific DNA-methyltransferase (adenine-specific)